ncbi:hypothetical protein DSM3645_00655 [Blastopirellula marina DSM 3645]|uniref:Uncharacterized protein n=1 Tax=Blastopirellula marina DSM 3645 TaxID=314230 RepID=A3ZMK6_9BACT|nr:hypothetical protein DSM3645_00655 [Blastopirellula marina DSM 3645]
MRRSEPKQNKSFLYFWPNDLTPSALFRQKALRYFAKVAQDGGELRRI